ncbi:MULTISPECIES: DUF262 domain-containing protein [Leptolyngbya]|uniref:DUF262 domain-containing protein n=1 Tax=Leptolyngbya TaxID=47251 RepID=UPI001682B7F3|nr:DUF262 domain-containing protein [Leptolyngbya sp. FACHB-1624]MBD1857079.1 DUF262 domain-containing protein [Leptolyngbya sp. FACHB-1624]
MTEKINVKPDTIFLEDLLSDVADGKYKIPIFQRDFVWKPSQMLELFDSILKGYPIGSLLFWKTKGYKTKQEVGPYIIEEDETDDVKYVLDGFQRISTLFGALTNPKDHKQHNNSNYKDFLIYFNIKENNFSLLKNTKEKSVLSIPLYEIYGNRELFNLLRELDKEEFTESEKNEYIENARNLHNILHKYKLPFVEIKGGDIKSAVEIFSRINSTGTEISEDFMLSALSYNDKTGFLLSDSITEFLNDLNTYNFEDLKRDTILNCISNSKGKIYFDVKIEELRSQNLIEDLENFAKKAYAHIRKAVAFLYKRLHVVHVRLLPYPTQLIFISEYFRLNSTPSLEQYKSLEDWFWITTYSNYFTLYSLSQQRVAYQEFCRFAEGEHPDGVYKLNNDIRFSTAKYPDKLNFTGVRPKALQLFYLNSLLRENETQDKEGVKEFFISASSKKDRTPANIVLRLSSEFEEDKRKKSLDYFIRNSSPEVLEQHFITQEMLEMYENSIDEFIVKREDYLKGKEKEFVENLGIKYTI